MRASAAGETALLIIRASVVPELKSVYFVENRRVVGAVGNTISYRLHEIVFGLRSNKFVGDVQVNGAGLHRVAETRRVETKIAGGLNRKCE